MWSARYKIKCFHLGSTWPIPAAFRKSHQYAIAESSCDVHFCIVKNIFIKGLTPTKNITHENNYAHGSKSA